MKQTRRNFIINMAKGVLTTSSIPLFMSCGGLVRSKIDSGPVFPENLFPGMDKSFASILYFASLAPSGHNAQPWTVKIINNSTWIIGADKNRYLPAVDPDNRATLLGIGAFLENLSVASGALGYEADIKFITNNAFDENIARVSLKKGQTVDYPLHNIIARRTVRKGFLPNPIKKIDLQVLLSSIRENSFYFPRNSKHAMCIEDAQISAFKTQVKRSAAMQELKAWFRLSDKDAEKFRDGLTAEGMDLTGVKGWYIRNFMDPEDMLSDFAIKTSIEMNEEAVRQGAGWIVITSKSNSVADIVEAGRKFEKIALSARKLNIAIAPMTQLLEEKTGQDLIASNHGGKLFPQMVLRVGYLEHYPDPVTLRRPVGWFVSPNDKTLG